MNDIEKKIEKRKTQEPTMEQLKDMVAQLSRENDHLKTTVRQAGSAIAKFKTLLVFTIEMCHDKEQTLLHDNAMANAAMSRNPGTE